MINEHDNAKRARELDLDGNSVDAIALALGVAVDWVRGVLASANDSTAPKPERPAPAPARAVDSDLAALERMNRELQDRVRHGYIPEPGGGRMRDGRPAPAPGEMARAYDTTSDRMGRRGRLGL